MRKYLLILLGFLAVPFAPTGLLAQKQSASTSSVGALNSEEIRLIQAFRANAAPFRNILYGQNLSEAGPVGSDDMAIIGPRDVIDVTISGGKIAFFGKRREYAAASIRLVRNEDHYIIVGLENSAIETRVKVSFRADGLHFDIREPYGQSSALPRGFIVIPESKDWKTGETIKWKGTLSDPQSLSKAENISFLIRYVSR